MKFSMSLFAAAAVFTFSASANPALAQQFPAKPVTLITPFPPGSGPDALLRLVGDRLSRSWGQQVTIENRPGGNGVIAVQAAKKASPDGYTLLQVDNMYLSAQPYLLKKLPYNLVTDFEPVTTMSRNYFFVTVPSTSSWKSMADLIDAAKAKPGNVTYGSWFVGSPGHLGAARLESATGTRMTHVPFKEMSQLYTAVGNNEVSWAFGSAGSAGAMQRAGKIKYLAVAAPKRIAGYEDVPTVAELGGPADFELSAWTALIAPRGTPNPVIDKIHRDIAQVLAEPDVRQRLVTSLGYETMTLSSSEFAEVVKTESVKYGEIIKRANITLD